MRGVARLHRRSREAPPRADRLCRQRARQSRLCPRRGREADRELPARAAARRHPRPVLGPRGSDRRQRARRHVRRAREPRRLFPAGAGHDAVRRGQLHLARHRQGARPLRDAPRARRRGGGTHREAAEARPRRARRLLRQPQQEGAERQDRSADRPRAGGRPHHPDPVPPLQEQSALCRRSRRRQDGDRRGPGAPHRPARGAGGAAERHHLRARHGRAPGRHALSRRFRGASEGGARRARGDERRDPVHRRDPHRDRRRRHQRRRDGRLEPVEAGARRRRHPLHRLDDLQGIPQLFREGPRARPPLPEDRRQRADGRGRGEDPARPEALLRAPPQGALHRRRDPRRGRAVEPLHRRPQASRQGDRRDRRGRRGADASAREPPAQDDHRARGRGDRRDDRAHPAEERLDATTARF